MPTPVSVTVEVQDKMTATMNKIMRSVNDTTAAYEKLGVASDEAFKTASIEAVQQQVVAYERRIEELENKLGGVKDNLAHMNEEAVKHNEQLQNILGMWGKIKTAIGALGIGVMIKRAIDGASDLEEVQNVVDVSFGDQAERVNEWAKTTLETVGLNELSAKRYSSTMAAMMASSGLAGNEVADMGMKLTELAGDMASFYNISGDVAFDKIRAGLSGENEPLKQLGINMSVANMEAFALSQGISKSYAKMSQGEQVLLRYQYLMQTTAQAQGDFSRTFRSYANQSKVLAETVKQVWQDVGAILLPVATAVVRAMNFAMGYVRKAVGYIKDHIEYIAPVIISLGAVVGAYAGYMGAVAAATWIATVAQKAWNAACAMSPVFWIAAGIALIVGLFISLATYIANTHKEANNFFSVLCGWAFVAGSAVANFGVLVGNTLYGVLQVACAIFSNLGKAFWDVILSIGGGINVAGTAIGNFVKFQANVIYQLYSAFKSVAENIGIAFKNSFSNVQGFFYDVLATALDVVEKMCVALNKLPFVEFDFSGIESGASEYRRKAEEASNSKGEYTSISDAWNKNADHFGKAYEDGWVEKAYKDIDDYTPKFESISDTWKNREKPLGEAFADGWNTDAWKNGTQWGNDKSKKILEKLGLSAEQEDKNSKAEQALAKQTAVNTGAISKNIDITKENLVYLRDLAEKEAINKFTTAKISVRMTNNNSIAKEADSDAIINQLVDGVQEAMSNSAKGVYN